MKQHFENWLCGWADMICGLLYVVTFTLYRPWWDYKLRSYFTLKNLKNKMKKNT